MKMIKRLGLVAVMLALVALMVAVGLGGVGTGTAGLPPDPASCYCTRPDLSLSQSAVYWEDYQAYLDRTLSVDFEIHNNSSNIANAHDMHVTGAMNTNGVVASDFGRNINVVTAGECELFTMQYDVPMGVSSFTTRVSAETHDQCGTAYSYGPSMMP